MPLAFLWRTRYSWNVLKETMGVVKDKGGMRKCKGWWMAAGGVATVFCCNVYWTAKIVQGAYKKLTKGKKKADKKKEENGTNGTNGTPAPSEPAK